MLRRSSVLVFSALALAACSSNVDETPAGTGGSAATTTTGGGDTTAATTTGAGGAGAGGTGGFDPGGEVTTLETGLTLPAVPSGFEDTQCVTVSLKNVDGAFVRRFRATLNAGSHHMIIYRSEATQEDLAPKHCEPFSGILGGEHPIFIAQQADAQLVFPTDTDGTPVGFEIAPNQMVKLEMHHINTTDAPLDVAGKIELDTVPLSAKVVKSDLAFWGTNNIDIPPNSAWSTPVKFQKALGGTKSFALTTHQHQLGTRMRVWYATGTSDINQEPVADGQNWHDPPLEIFDPPLEFAPGSGKYSDKGFAYQCEWKNTTPQQVGFGEGFNDEMCFLWHYYYPSQGFQICFNGFCKASGP